MNNNYESLNIILHSVQMETNVKRYKARDSIVSSDTDWNRNDERALAKFRSSFTHNKGDLHMWHYIGN